MDKKGLDREVAAHPFLTGLSDPHLRLLADCAMRTNFEPGQVIFREGETANRFYLIESGEVVLDSLGDESRAVTIEEIGPGGLLGWSWLFPPYMWHFTAHATQPTAALFFYGTVLREYCETDASFGFELFRRMSEVMTRRLQAARTRLVEHYRARPQ